MPKTKRLKNLQPGNSRAYAKP